MASQFVLLDRWVRDRRSFVVVALSCLRVLILLYNVSINSFFLLFAPFSDFELSCFCFNSCLVFSFDYVFEIRLFFIFFVVRWCWLRFFVCKLLCSFRFTFRMLSIQMMLCMIFRCEIFKNNFFDHLCFIIVATIGHWPLQLCPTHFAACMLYVELCIIKMPQWNIGVFIKCYCVTSCLYIRKSVAEKFIS